MAIKVSCVVYCTLVVLLLERVQHGLSDDNQNPNQVQLWLTISAQKQFIEVSWKNAPAHNDDLIMLTTHEPKIFQKLVVTTGTPLARLDTDDGSGDSYIPIDGYTTTRNYIDGASRISQDIDEPRSMFSTLQSKPKPQTIWTSNGEPDDVIGAIKPTANDQWFTTGIPFNYNLSKNITIDTNCYGFWASYVNGNGQILTTNCIRAFPRWMKDMHSVVGGMRVRDLFLPGTHDSGAYRIKPPKFENIVTKYSITQDEDVFGQLMHGVRYLDIRIGYYGNSIEKFFINHGITRHYPLQDIIAQVKEFVQQTNEVVIFGIKEFPVGFGKNLDVHRLLVHLLKKQFDDLIVDPSLTWRASINDIWSRKQNVILAYDHGVIVREHPEILFQSVEQRWGNVRNWKSLEQHLRAVNTFDTLRLSSRPIADMAELTPDTLGVILDQYGGLRKMSDNVNWRVSQLYRDELGQHANIVAVDFMRSTSIVEIALEWNKRKVIY